MNVFLTIWNRFTWAIPLCEDFAKAGLNVILIDNNSTFPPCVEWLKNCPYKVHHMEKNEAPWAFFTTDLYHQYTDRYFMISDSDQSITGIPDDWIEVLMKGLEETEDGVWKSGLSQRIDDLPDNPYAREIYEYEKNFYTNVNRFGYYKVAMDLGIAIYDRERRGNNPIREKDWYNAVRSPLPYASQHRDWYLTPDQFREEDIYYMTNKDIAHYGWIFKYTDKHN